MAHRWRGRAVPDPAAVPGSLRTLLLVLLLERERWERCDGRRGGLRVPRTRAGVHRETLWVPALTLPLWSVNSAWRCGSGAVGGGLLVCRVRVGPLEVLVAVPPRDLTLSLSWSTLTARPRNRRGSIVEAHDGLSELLHHRCTTMVMRRRAVARRAVVLASEQAIFTALSALTGRVHCAARRTALWCSANVTFDTVLPSREATRAAHVTIWVRVRRVELFGVTLEPVPSCPADSK